MQQDNNPKHTIHSTKEGLKRVKEESQSSDLNPVKMLWKDLSEQFIGFKICIRHIHNYTEYNQQ